MADDKLDEVRDDGSICLHCRVAAAIAQWGLDETAAGIQQSPEEQGADILAAMCMVIVDVLLQDRSDGAMDDFKENSQRVMQTIIELYNSEVPPERMLLVKFAAGNRGSLIPNPRKHLN
jgi:hypothetical protein